MSTSFCRHVLSSTRGTNLHTPARRWLHRSISTQVRSISASDNEMRRGRLTERNLEQAVHALFNDGIVVVENAISRHHLDNLNKKMLEDTTYLSDLGDTSPFNYNRSNLQQDPPPTKEHFEPSIFLSEFPILLVTVTDSVRSYRISDLFDGAWTKT